MARVVDALRDEEAKYRDIESVVRVVGRNPQLKDPAGSSDVTPMLRRRAVFQGDRSYFRHEAFERVQAIKYRHEDVSAFDGEKTRTVIGGNAVNIHLGAWRHPRLLPAHCLSISHQGINFPLSIYLAGTRAIHAHLGYPPGLAEKSPYQNYYKVESVLEGEEDINGLRCLKVCSYRWPQPNQAPVKVRLWLAPSRNYHVIREDQDLNGFWYETTVPELREAAPGVWFPSRVSLVISQGNGPVRSDGMC